MGGQVNSTVRTTGEGSSVRWIESWVATAPSPTHPDRNEDHWWVAASRQAAAVIDGMGGYRRKSEAGEVGGEHAATLASQVLGEHLNGWDNAVPLQDAKVRLRAAIEQVNARIWEQLNWSGQVPASENLDGKAPDELSVGVALTVVALCDGGTRAVAAQHGDTHGYALKEVGLLQITEDQDLLLWERMNGRISEEEAAQISQTIDNFDGVSLAQVPDQRVMRYFFDKNIFGALGVDGVCPDTGWSVIKLQPGDRLALLSDGAYSNLTLNELSGLLSYPEDPASVVVDLAKQRSILARFPDPNDLTKPFNMRATQDDMTAVVVELGEATEPLPDTTTPEPVSLTPEPPPVPADAVSVASNGAEPEDTNAAEPAGVPEAVPSSDDAPVEAGEPDAPMDDELPAIGHA